MASFFLFERTVECHMSLDVFTCEKSKEAMVRWASGLWPSTSHRRSPLPEPSEVTHTGPTSLQSPDRNQGFGSSGTPVTGCQEHSFIITS